MDSTVAIQIGLAAFGGYLLGSFPAGLVLSRAFGFGDIRKQGSGNIGATNVLRVTKRRDLTLATFVLDAGKAGIAAVLAGTVFGPALGPSAALVAAGAAFLGHLYPVWLGFEGGKGVATFFGTFFVVAWPVGVVAAITWIAIAYMFRFSSLAALVAVAVTPLAALAMPSPVGGPFPGAALLAVFMGVLIYWRHRGNIQRLLDGSEPRIGDKRETAPAP